MSEETGCRQSPARQSLSRIARGLVLPPEIIVRWSRTVEKGSFYCSGITPALLFLTRSRREAHTLVAHPDDVKEVRALLKDCDFDWSETGLDELDEEDR